jgi:uncharacterized protein (TIGR03083 family)
MTMQTNAPRRAPRRSALDRKVAMRLAATEYRRVADALADLDADDWAKPTDCPGWDVRALGCHIVGMATMVKGRRESARQQKLAAIAVQRDGVEPVDALTALQVDERADWTPADVVSGARAIAPRAARGRRFTPYVVRRRTLPAAQLVNGVREEWTIGYLVDTILTRDPWMHRTDLAAATGRPMHLTADHDGRIVADVVEEWAERHGQPYRLTLGGPAGGTWTRGTDGEQIEMGAVEFCRILSGRGAGSGLLATQVPF